MGGWNLGGLNLGRWRLGGWRLDTRQAPQKGLGLVLVLAGLAVTFRYLPFWFWAVLAGVFTAAAGWAMLRE